MFARTARHDLARVRSPRRVLVIATGQIGDVLLTTPLVRRARLLWPAAEIDVLGFAETLGMLKGNPDIGRLIGAPSHGGAAATLRFAKAEGLWRRYDVALITQQNDRAHLLGFIAAPVRSGIVSPDLKTSWWKRALLAHRVSLAGDWGDIHVVDEKLALLDPWMSLQTDSSIRDVIYTASEMLPEELRLSLQDPFVVVQVPSMWQYKQWPLEHFVILTKALVAAGVRVVLTGGSSADDRQKVSEVALSVESDSVVDACGRLNFAQLASALRLASLYIGPDTSVTHLAAALGVQTIALFGPTNPVRWGPRGPRGDLVEPWQRIAAVQKRVNVTMLQGPGRCVPCGRSGCHDHRQSRSLCLEEVLPARVVATAFEILEGQRAARQLACLQASALRGRGLELSED
jgi:heptosyltransferase-3